MSLYGGIQHERISPSNLEQQLSHLKKMAQGANGTAFTYGDFTDSTEFDPQEKLLHTDGFGFYLRTEQGEYAKTFNRSVNSINNRLVTGCGDDQPMISMMHARLATKGSKDSRNLQPMPFSHIVGMHNGSLDGLESEGLSDSHYILSTINDYVGESTNSQKQISGLEQMLISKVVEKCTGYGAMNLMVYLKHTNQVLILCSYNEHDLHSQQHRQYYQMRISSDGKRVYVASESGNTPGQVLYTENHCLYVVDMTTGKIKKIPLPKLKEAIQKKKKDKKQSGQGSKAESGKKAEKGMKKTSQSDGKKSAKKKS